MIPFDPAGTHPFLLTFYSRPNHRPISHTASDFCWKSPIFPTSPCIYSPRWRGYHWNWYRRQGSKN